MKVNKQNGKRIQEMDALRGFALFGILLVNIFVFHAPYSYYAEFYGAFEGKQAAVVDFVVQLFAGKFMFIFAFLFGYGIHLQQLSQGEKFNLHFTKRMLVLLVFGIMHLIVFWFGDILTSYALLGLLLIPLYKMPNWTILGLSIIFLLFRSFYYFGVVWFEWPMVHDAKPAEINEFMTVFQQGTYIEVFNLRMKELFVFMPENLVWYIPKTAGLFLLGVLAARKKLFKNIKEKQLIFFVITVILLAISIAWALGKAEVFSWFDLDAQPIWRPFLIGINVFFETALGCGYIIGLILLFQNANWLTTILAKTGRLALTNYILQSLCCVLIFYSYGLGYYGGLKPTDLVILAIVVYSFGTIFSIIYLKYRSTGPLEFLWRKLIGK